MKERPILFSGPMVRAILAGTKTQTRRVVKLPLRDRDFGCELAGSEIGQAEAHRLCPYGQPGDALWVRETYAKRVDCEDGSDKAKHYLLYAADGSDVRDPMNWHDYGGKWRPSIFMPRWASRITLRVTGVRVERLQDISEADALAEGIAETPWAQFPSIEAYRFAWDAINGARAPWASNPWVWVVEFQRQAMTAERLRVADEGGMG